MFEQKFQKSDKHHKRRILKMTITKDIRYIGVNDHRVDLFEGQYKVPNSMAYNSYAIMETRSRSWTQWT